MVESSLPFDQAFRSDKKPREIDKYQYFAKQHLLTFQGERNKAPSNAIIHQINLKSDGFGIPTDS